MTLTRPQEAFCEFFREITGIIPVIDDMQKEVEANPTNASIIANTIWAFNKAKQKMEVLEKAINKARHVADTKFCDLMALTEEKNHKTEFGTVTPQPSFFLQYPTTPDKPGYAEFVKQLPPEGVRPHYTFIEQKFAEAMMRGDQSIYGLNGTSYTSSFGTRVLSKKEM